MRDEQGGRERLLTSVIPVLFGAAGCALVLYSTSGFGIGMTPDSVKYLSVAENLASGLGYHYYNGNAFTAWPPLYPTVLAAFEFLGIGALRGARFLHALIFGTIIGIAGRVFFTQLRTKALAVLGTAAVLLSVPLLDTAVMMWSEPLFSLLVLLAALQLARYLELRRTVNLGLLTLLIAAACLQKYAGIGFVLAVALLLLHGNDKPLSQRLKRTAGFVVFALLPLALWVLRNYTLEGAFFGERHPLVRGNILDILRTLTLFLLPLHMRVWGRLAIVLVVAAALITVAIRQARRTSQAEDVCPLVRVAATFTLLYAGFLLLAAPLGVGDPLCFRYLSSVHVFVILLVLVATESLRDWLNERIKRWPAHFIVVGLLVLWLMPAAHMMAAQIKNHSAQRIGFAAREWRESPLIAWLKSHGLPGRIESNNPDVIYLHTKLSAFESPSRHDPLFVERELRHLLDSVHLVWFERSYRPDLWTPRELSQWFDLEPEHEFSDGTIYYVRMPAR